MSPDSRDQPIRLPLLRLVAERLASPAVRERVLHPLLADLQFEYSRAATRAERAMVRARGTWAFWQAFGLGGLEASCRHMRANAWGRTPEEQRALPRLLGCVALSTLAVSVLMLGDWWSRPWPRGLSPRSLPVEVWCLALPGILTTAIPLGLLFGVILVAGRGDAFDHRRLLAGVSVLAGLTTFAMAAWLTPLTNQEHRVRVWRAISHQTGELSRGDRELSLDELAVRAAERRAAGQVDEAARLDLEWQKKPAFGASCLALALCGLAITRRVRPSLARHGVALATAFVTFALLRLGEQMADAGGISPVEAMWGPVLFVALLSALLLVQRPLRA